PQAAARGPAKFTQHFASVERIEEINKPGIFAFHKANFHCLHEPADGEPEIIPHQDEALDSSPIALSQRLHEFRIHVTLLCMEPLLELVEHQQHLLARFQEPSLP